MAKWQVYAPNGHTLICNMGGYGTATYKHGQIVGDPKIAKAFPQYFHLLEDEVVVEMKEKAAVSVQTLEEELLKETSDGEQMLTEVPKVKAVKAEDSKPESADEDSEAVPLVEKKSAKKQRGEFARTSK